METEGEDDQDQDDCVEVIYKGNEVVNVEEDDDDEDSDNNMENTNDHEQHPPDGKLERLEFEKANEEKNPTNELDMEDESSTDSRTAERYSELAYKRDCKLIELYKNFPILYNRRHDYKKNYKKEKAWRDLTKLANMPLEACKKRMTLLRCRFSVERRIYRNGVPDSDWPLLERLKFLHKHIRMRKSIVNREPANSENELNGFENPANNGAYFIKKSEANGDDADHSNFASSKLTIRKRRASEPDEDDQPDVQISAYNMRERTSIPHPPTTTVLHQTQPSFHHIKPPQPVRDEHTIFGEFVTEVLRKLKLKAPATTLKVMTILVEAQNELNIAETSQNHHPAGLENSYN